MTSHCTGLKPKDIQAFKLCTARVAEGDTLSELDAGSSKLNFSDPDQPKREAFGAGDGKVSAAEIYRRVLGVVLEEESRRAQSYLKNLAKPPAFSSDQLKLFRDKGNTRVPFVFDDLDANTNHDEKLFLKCLKKIQGIKKSLSKEGIKEESEAYRRRLAKELFHFIHDPKKQGGLGVAFDAQGNRPERDLAGIAREGKATCVEFAFFFDALARLAGLDATPVEVFRDQNGHLNEHIRMGVRLDDKDPAKMFFLDISSGLAGERTGELWTEIPRLELLAHYYNGLNVGSDVSKDREAYLQQALRYAPDQYLILSNYGHFLLEKGGAVDQALDLFLQARDANPQYPFIFRGLAKVYEAQGKSKKAEAAAKEAEDLFKPRPQPSNSNSKSKS